MDHNSLVTFSNSLSQTTLLTTEPRVHIILDLMEWLNELSRQLRISSKKPSLTKEILIWHLWKTISDVLGYPAQKLKGR